MTYDLIGISGKKQSGKNTLANKIVEVQNYSSRHPSIWSTDSFARPLKEAIAAMLDINVDWLENEEFKNCTSPIMKPDINVPYTYRELLQKFGTEVGRSISSNIWTNLAMLNYDHGSHYKIFTDVRFENEAEAIKLRGGLLIRVNRDTGLTDDHISETALDHYTGFDEYIDNNGKMSELDNIVIKLFNKYNL